MTTVSCYLQGEIRVAKRLTFVSRDVGESWPTPIPCARSGAMTIVPSVVCHTRAELDDMVLYTLKAWELMTPSSTDQAQVLTYSELKIDDVTALAEAFAELSVDPTSAVFVDRMLIEESEDYYAETFSSYGWKWLLNSNLWIKTSREDVFENPIFRQPITARAYGKKSAPSRGSRLDRTLRSEQVCMDNSCKTRMLRCMQECVALLGEALNNVRQCGVDTGSLGIAAIATGCRVRNLLQAEKDTACVSEVEACEIQAETPPAPAEVQIAAPHIILPQVFIHGPCHFADASSEHLCGSVCGSSTVHFGPCIPGGLVRESDMGKPFVVQIPNGMLLEVRLLPNPAYHTGYDNRIVYPSATSQFAYPQGLVGYSNYQAICPYSEQAYSYNQQAYTDSQFAYSNNQLAGPDNQLGAETLPLQHQHEWESLLVGHISEYQRPAWNQIPWAHQADQGCSTGCEEHFAEPQMPALVGAESAYFGVCENSTTQQIELGLPLSAEQSMQFPAETECRLEQSDEQGAGQSDECHAPALVRSISCDESEVDDSEDMEDQYRESVWNSFQPMSSQTDSRSETSSHSEVDSAGLDLDNECSPSISDDATEEDPVTGLELGAVLDEPKTVNDEPKTVNDDSSASDDQVRTPTHELNTASTAVYQPRTPTYRRALSGSMSSNCRLVHSMRRSRGSSRLVPAAWTPSGLASIPEEENELSEKFHEPCSFLTLASEKSDKPADLGALLNEGLAKSAQVEEKIDSMAENAIDSKTSLVASSPVLCESVKEVTTIESVLATCPVLATCSVAAITSAVAPVKALAVAGTQGDSTKSSKKAKRTKQSGVPMLIDMRLVKSLVTGVSENDESEKGEKMVTETECRTVSVTEERVVSVTDEKVVSVTEEKVVSVTGEKEYNSDSGRDVSERTAVSLSAREGAETTRPIHDLTGQKDGKMMSPQALSESVLSGQMEKRLNTESELLLAGKNVLESSSSRIATHMVSASVTSATDGNFASSTVDASSPILGDVKTPELVDVKTPEPVDVKTTELDDVKTPSIEEVSSTPAMPPAKVYRRPWKGEGRTRWSVYMSIAESRIKLGISDLVGPYGTVLESSAVSSNDAVEVTMGSPVAVNPSFDAEVNAPLIGDVKTPEVGVASSSPVSVSALLVGDVKAPELDDVSRPLPVSVTAPLIDDVTMPPLADVTPPICDVNPAPATTAKVCRRPWKRGCRVRWSDGISESDAAVTRGSPAAVPASSSADVKAALLGDVNTQEVVEVKAPEVGDVTISSSAAVSTLLMGDVKALELGDVTISSSAAVSTLLMGDVKTPELRDVSISSYADLIANLIGDWNTPPHADVKATPEASPARVYKSLWKAGSRTRMAFDSTMAESRAKLGITDLVEPCGIVLEGTTVLCESDESARGSLAIACDPPAKVSDQQVQSVPAQLGAERDSRREECIRDTLGMPEQTPRPTLEVSTHMETVSGDAVCGSSTATPRDKRAKKAQTGSLIDLTLVKSLATQDQQPAIGNCAADGIVKGAQIGASVLEQLLSPTRSRRLESTGPESQNLLSAGPNSPVSSARRVITIGRTWWSPESKLSDEPNEYSFNIQYPPDWNPHRFHAVKKPEIKQPEMTLGIRPPGLELGVKSPGTSPRPNLSVEKGATWAEIVKSPDALRSHKAATEGLLPSYVLVAVQDSKPVPKHDSEPIARQDSEQITMPVTRRNSNESTVSSAGTTGLVDQDVTFALKEGGSSDDRLGDKSCSDINGGVTDQGVVSIGVFRTAPTPPNESSVIKTIAEEQVACDKPVSDNLGPGGSSRARPETRTGPSPRNEPAHRPQPVPRPQSTSKPQPLSRPQPAPRPQSTPRPQSASGAGAASWNGPERNGTNRVLAAKAKCVERTTVTLTSADGRLSLSVVAPANPRASAAKTSSTAPLVPPRPITEQAPRPPAAQPSRGGRRPPKIVRTSKVTLTPAAFFSDTKSQVDNLGQKGAKSKWTSESS